ncbi:FHA domain-containing protein [Leucobacter sp. HY1910]
MPAAPPAPPAPGGAVPSPSSFGNPWQPPAEDAQATVVQPSIFSAPQAAAVVTPEAPQAADPEPPAAPSRAVDLSDFESDDPDEEFEATVVLTRARSTTDWNLVDIDGTKFPLAPRNVLGRKPSSGPDDAQYIALSDPNRVLSRTHLLIEVEADQLWITDLKSTNGTEIVAGAGVASTSGAGSSDEMQPCEALSRYALTADQGLSLGGRSITFERPASS